MINSSARHLLRRIIQNCLSFEMSSSLWLLKASPPADWPPRPRAAEVAMGRERLSGARYMYGCALLRIRENARAWREYTSATASWAENWTLLTLSHTHRHAQRTKAAEADGLNSVHYSSSTEEREKFGEMQSVYQHLVSLLFVFSSLHVYQLTEGCSCALTHPQDAFCNSDIGKWRECVDSFATVSHF